MGLKELIADLKGERAKGDKADQAVISGLLDDIEPIASRDYATIKRLEAKASGKSTEDVTALENQIVALTNERDDAKNESVKLAKSAKAEESKRMAAEKERDEKVGASEGAISQLLVDGGLASALSGKVRPAHLEAVKGLLSRSVTVESDGKSRSAIAVLKDKAVIAELAGEEMTESGIMHTIAGGR